MINRAKKTTDAQRDEIAALIMRTFPQANVPLPRPRPAEPGWRGLPMSNLVDDRRGETVPMRSIPEMAWEGLKWLGPKEEDYRYYPQTQTVDGDPYGMHGDLDQYLANRMGPTAPYHNPAQIMPRSDEDTDTLAMGAP